MWLHALLSFYRALTRHRLYSALNIFGLAIGVAVFLVPTLEVGFETSFEKWIPSVQSIYVVRTGWQFPGRALDVHNASMGGLLDELRQDYPQLMGTRVWDNSGIVRQGAQVSSEQVEVVDPGFFKVFDLPLQRGDKAHLLASPDDLILSETRAKRYFGSTNPIGQRITLSVRGKVTDYRVAGILKDLPKNTDLQFDIIVPLTPQMVADHGRTWRHWGSEELSTFLKFDTAREANALDADLDRFTDLYGAADIGPHAHTEFRLRTLPLASLHLIDPKDVALIATIGMVGILTLLLAAVNYINLATARAGLRAREVALRKVVGATSRTLVMQFMLEALATSFFAGLIGLALTEIALPFINSAGGLNLKIDYLGHESIVPLLALVIALVGGCAGLYPAFLLARFQPSQVLAAARSPGGGRVGARVREGLVIFQFTVAIGFTILTGVIVSQGRYLRHADLGFNRTGIIVIDSYYPEITQAQRASLLAAWRSIPGVIGITHADIGPGNEDNTDATNFKRPGTPGDWPSLNWVEVGPDFISTYSARLIAGRALDQNHGLDEKPMIPDGSSTADANKILRNSNRNVVLNATALKVLGFKTASEALGKPVLMGLDAGGFETLTVVGVVADIRFRTPKKPVPPTIYMFNGREVGNVVGVRYASDDPRRVQALLEQAFRHIAPNVPFRANTIEDNLEGYYRSDDQRGRLFTLCAILAVAIGCVGLYGLAAFNTTRRVKEIGIRKTHGASTIDILKLLIGQFLRPVLVANLIAWPVAYLVTSNWLAGFDQRISLNLLYFLAPSVLTALVATGTVAGQALTVARAEPARALRHD